MSIAFQIFKAIWGLTRRDLAIRTYQDTSGEEVELDQTGITAEPGIQPISEIYRDPIQGVVLARYRNSVAHSYWRAQELSLFARIRTKFRAPIVDFGCGDGSFSNCIFDQIDIGVDIDKEALTAAHNLGLYNSLLTFDEMADRIKDGSIETVFSVSALEHTYDLPACLREISRVLSRTGTFYFTVPNPNLTRQMTELIGPQFADHMNSIMYHRNLLDLSQWSRLLMEAGMQIVSDTTFQTTNFTRTYFALSLLGRRGLGRIPCMAFLFWQARKMAIVSEVAASIRDDVQHGANFLLAARRT